MCERVTLPSLKQLRAFDAAGRLGSFKAAADSLYVSPSTISHQVAGLEAFLGVKLFRRSSRKLELTQEGRRYLEDVSAAFERLRLATAAIRRDRDPDTVRISANPFLSSEILIPLVEDFEKAFPDQVIRISTTENIEDPRDGEVDFAVRFGHGRWEGLEVDQLTDIVLRPIAAPGIDADDAPRIDFFYQATSCWAAWQKAGLPVFGTQRNGRQFTSFAAAMQAVERGLGVGLGQFPLMNAWLADGRIRVLDDDHELAVGCLYLLSRSLPASHGRMREVRHWLQSCLVQKLTA